jgi:hypothetical protein
MKIQLTKTIDDQVLENIFVTAIEGGSNYWYFLSDEAVEIIRRYVPYSDDPYLSTAIFKAIKLGAIIPINDAENEEDVVGELTISTFATRLQKMYEDGNGHALDSEIAEEGDAGTSDVVFQYLAMGEVVYG